MKRIIIISLTAVVLSGCAPRPVVVEKPVVAETPTAAKDSVVDLSIESNHEKLNLSWRKVGQGLISGYNIYISERPLAALFPGGKIDPSIAAYNTNPFPGDTIPEDGVEHFMADRLANGVRYYVTVRIVYPDGTVSGPSNEVTAVCGGRGEFELALRRSGGKDGFSFSDNKYVACDDKISDLYYFSKDGLDYLASPNRLDAFARQTRFVVLPWKGRYHEIVARLSDNVPVPSLEKVTVAEGDWVLAECAGKTHALISVKALKGTPPGRLMTISYVYSSLSGELVF